MKFAIMSDVHANPVALETALADARALGCEKFAMLGDITGYGYDPKRAISLVRENFDLASFRLRALRYGGQDGGQVEEIKRLEPPSPRSRRRRDGVCLHAQDGNYRQRGVSGEYHVATQIQGRGEQAAGAADPPTRPPDGDWVAGPVFLEVTSGGTTVEFQVAFVNPFLV